MSRNTVSDNKQNTGIMALEVIMGINGINSDLRSLSRSSGYGNNGEEITSEELLYLGKLCGLKLRKKNIKLKDFGNKYPLPVICKNKAGGYSVLLGIKEETQKVLVLPLPGRRVVMKDMEEYENETEDEIFITGKRINGKEAEFGLRWIINEISSYRGIISEVMLGSMVVQLFGIITPLFTQVIIDKVLVHYSVSTLRVMTGAFIGAAVFEVALNISRNYIFVHTTNKIDAKLGAKIFRHLMRLYYVYFENRPVGNIIMRVRELDRVREFITEKSVTLLIDTLFSTVFAIVMLMYSVKLTLIVFGFMVLTGVIYLSITPEIRQRLEERFRMSSKQNSYLVETVTGIQTVKSLSIEGVMTRHWEDKLGEYVRAGFRLTMLGKVTGTISQFVQKMMTIALLYAGVMEVMGGRLTIGQLIAFQMIAGQFSGPMLRLLSLWNEFQQVLLSVERIGEILNSPCEDANAGKIRLNKIEGNIRIENLKFRYSADGAEVLRGINLDIPAGMRVGIVGRSGSGKSTIGKLLQRMYYATEGAIYIDGTDIKNMDAGWLRSEIGVVMQESYLFSGNIRENIGIGVPGASMEQIINTARKSGAEEFIAKLPQGYETEVGERGSALSGGQKQRIAIARALITEPSILIMDEATSSLDYESERIIRKNMKQISAGRTTIIIAHRLSAVRDCDIILCLDNGKIVEQGSHEELMAAGGYYRKMYEAQQA